MNCLWVQRRGGSSFVALAFSLLCALQKELDARRLYATSPSI